MTTESGEKNTPRDSCGNSPPTRQISPRLDLLLPADSPIRSLWERSKETLVRFKDVLSREDDLEIIETIGVSGSYARMEAVSGSDLDLFAVVRDDADPESIDVLERRLKELVLETVVKLPSGKGIFSKPIKQREIFAASQGQIDEAPQPFGIRIQSLLDSQPVWQAERFLKLQRMVLQRYLTPVQFANRDEAWAYLVHDLARYFRSLALKYQWEDQKQFSRWSLRNVKGSFSRPLMHVALLTLLGESLLPGRDPESWVAARLHLTPLERLAETIPGSLSANLKEITLRYGEFLSSISRTEIRLEMSETDFLELKQRGEIFQNLLIQILQESSKRWPGAFVQRLWF